MVMSIGSWIVLSKSIIYICVFHHHHHRSVSPWPQNLHETNDSRMNLCKWAFSLLFWAFLILLKQHVTQHVNDKLRPCFTHVGPKNGLIEKCLTAFHMFHPSPCFTHVGLKNRHIEKLPHNISHVPPKFLSLNWSKDMFHKNYKTWPIEMSHSISSHFYHQCFAHVDLRRTGL